jgi:hypothetical protein
MIIFQDIALLKLYFGFICNLVENASLNFLCATELINNSSKYCEESQELIFEADE